MYIDEAGDQRETRDIQPQVGIDVTEVPNGADSIACQADVGEYRSFVRTRIDRCSRENDGQPVRTSRVIGWRFAGASDLHKECS